MGLTAAPSDNTFRYEFFKAGLGLGGNDSCYRLTATSDCDLLAPPHIIQILA